MTHIDFYVLDSAEPNALGLLACRLAEKIWRMGRRVYVHTANAGQAQALDDLLWTFRDGSFVPHELYSPGAEEPAPVVIGCDPDPQLEPDVLINLAEAVPPCFSRFQRLAELVDADPARREASRERWRFYRDRGYPLQKHDL
jgi:DNA polymerase-3 subunit chi